MTKNYYRYNLDNPRITGRRQQKTTCPLCGRKRCFVRYVDTQNQCHYLSDEVGRCDHELSCGYHYRPTDYFRDHAWMKPHPTSPAISQPRPIQLMPFEPIDQSHVLKTHSRESIFWSWMENDVRHRLGLNRQTLQRVYSDYFIGATASHDVVFWQIDDDYRVHTGHIMRYNHDGHRSGCQDWMHSRLQKDGLLPPEWTLYQCLFGQHLLRKYPYKQVCLVESEKTALIMAAYRPEQLWLATAGSGGLNADKLACLKGRTVRLFPDSGCYDKWKDKMQQTSGIYYYISKHLEQYEPNTDLADLLL